MTEETGVQWVVCEMCDGDGCSVCEEVGLIRVTPKPAQEPEQEADDGA